LQAQGEVATTAWADGTGWLPACLTHLAVLLDKSLQTSVGRHGGENLSQSRPMMAVRRPIGSLDSRE